MDIGQYSLTQEWIASPVADMLRPVELMAGGRRVSSREIVWHHFESNVLSRITTIFIVVVAPIDCALHTLACTYKVVVIELYHSGEVARSPYTNSEIEEHALLAWNAFNITIIAFMCIANPDFLFSLGYINTAIKVKGREHFDPRNAPEEIKELARRVIEGEIEAPYDPIRKAWNKGNNEQQHWIFITFSQDIAAFKNVRDALGDEFFDCDRLKERPHWQTPDEYSRRREHLRGDALPFSRAKFFHATRSEAALRSMLKAGCVEHRHEGAYPGAYVSTQPEEGFGHLTLAFNHSIQMGRVRHVPSAHRVVWAGFEDAIPVLPDVTLEGILVSGYSDEQIGRLEERVSFWAGRDIRVLRAPDNREDYSSRPSFPKIWRDIARIEA